MRPIQPKLTTAVVHSLHLPFFRMREIENRPPRCSVDTYATSYDDINAQLNVIDKFKDHFFLTVPPG